MEISDRVARLVDAWCERRSLRALREILRAWPPSGTLTDDWANLGEALKGVRAFAQPDLLDEEKNEVERLIAAVDEAVYRTHPPDTSSSEVG